MSERTNSPAPEINSQIQKKLAEIGGTVSAQNPEYGGQPNYKLVWGQTETCFDSGKMRLRFFEPNTDVILKKRAFRLSQKGFTMLGNYQKHRSIQMREAVNEQDWTAYHALLFISAEWFLQKFIPVTEWERLSSDSSAEETARLLPEGWLYFEDSPELLEIGSPRWYVVEFTPAHQIDSRESWERNRFGICPLMEFDGQEHFIDILGPYPEHGYHFNVITKIETSDGKYAAPDENNCIKPVQKHLREKHAATVQQTTKSFRHNFRESVMAEAYANMAQTKKEERIEQWREIGQVVFPNPNYKKSQNAVARIFPKEDKPYYGKPSKPKE